MRIGSAIILAGGTGSRLAPLNSQFNKHMIPVYNKFIIDYPIETLRKLGVKHLTVVLGGQHYEQVVAHLKDGQHLGMQINYVYQNAPSGIAQAINLCRPFVEHKDSFITILGDNIFENAIQFDEEADAKAQIVLHKHAELHRFGVASVIEGQIVKIEEKPKDIDPQYENYAIAGCYLFDSQFFKFFTHLKPSARNEYEIVDIIKMYNDQNDLGYGFVDGLWSDAGTHESINFVNNFFYRKEHLA